ncbi:MAG: nuclear transport factor 2 family protein [Solirubrobacterales bacterium]|nr:nuclear transport factor 2 family protein [Solirubrobacterales bacterium]
MPAADELRRLVDDRDIRDLALRYCHAWLVFDDELMASLWHRRAAAAEPPALDAHWVDALLPRWKSLGTTVLHVTNHLVEIAGDTASGRVSCLAQLDRGDRLVEQTIVYEDDYVRRDGRWGFDVRRHLLWFGEARANPLAQHPAHWPRSQVGAGTIPADLTPFP